jgi:hypothetical protein
VTLPAALGGGLGTLTFTTSTTEGLTDLNITVQNANFMQLFSLSNLSLQFSAPGTWTVDASTTASTGGSTTTSFRGSLSYSDNTLTSASLKVGNITLAGLFKISSLEVKYSKSSWSGSVVIQQSSGSSVSADVTLGFGGPNGALNMADITESGPISLFGVVTLDSFDMKYSDTSWSVGGTSTLAGKKSALAGSLETTDGVVSSANLTLTNVSFEGLMTIKTASASYGAVSASGCPDVVGPEVWCGSWDVELPQATVVTGVSGSLAIADGAFAQASIDVSGTVPLFLGVTLTQLGASVTVNPPPTTLLGTGTITFGVPIASVPLFSLQGTLTRVFSTSTTPGEYVVGGTLTALPGTSDALVLGTASVTDPDTGATTFALTLGSNASTGLSFSHLGISVNVTGSLTGSFKTSTFFISGQSQVTVTGIGTLTGNVKADNTGIAACASTTSGMVGFEYHWSTGSVQVFGTKGCSEQGF